jgi:hypothetical protein
MFTVQLKYHSCPACGKKLDAASSVLNSERGPQAGDYTVCLYCANIFRFTPTMELAPATAEEIAFLLEVAPDAFAVLMKVKHAARARIYQQALRN